MKKKKPALLLCGVFLIGILVTSPSIISAGCDVAGNATTTDNYATDPAWGLQWDPANPEEIQPGTTVTLNIIANNPITPQPGQPLLRWSVSGEGFTIEEFTTGYSNTLVAGPDICGSAEVTVSYYGGHDAVSGALRSPYGQWVLVDECSPNNYGIDGVGEVTGIHGQWKYEQDWCFEDCSINCGGGPCEVKSEKPEGACFVEASLKYEWRCE